MPIKISAPTAKVLERPKDKKLPLVLERPEVQKKEKRAKMPSPVRTQNDRNAANPRPGSVRQTIDRLPAAQYTEVKRQKEKLEAQKNLKQHKAFFELKRAREQEYYKVEEFLIDLELNFVVPQVREFIIEKWILRNRFDTIGVIMALKHHGKCLSRKEMNKLKHALNGNMALQAACLALVGTGLTFLMR